MRNTKALSIVVGLLTLTVAVSPLAAQPTPTWRLVQELRIDGAEQDLTFVGGIAPRANGDVYIAQPMDQVIKVFSSTGQLLRTIGQKGAGPGEFKRLGSIGWVGDSLYASDSELRRMTLFSPDGKLIRTIPNAPYSAEALKGDSAASHYLSLNITRMLSGNRAYAFPSMTSSDIAKGVINAMSLYRVDWTGAPQKRLAAYSYAHSQLAIIYANGAMFSNQPFNDDPIVAFSASGERFATLSADPAAKVIRVTDIRASGDTLGVRTIQYSPRPIPARYSDSVATGLQTMLTKRGIDADARKTLYVPRNFPGMTRALMEDDGALWLRLSIPTDARNQWMIVSPAGKPLGMLDVPKSVNLSTFANGVWATDTDSDGVMSVVKYRVDRNGTK